MADPSAVNSTAKNVLSDQHKLPLPAFSAAINYLADDSFEQARTRGVRLSMKYTCPGAINNDGTGLPYWDGSDKAANQGSISYEWAMDPREPVVWPDMLTPK